MRLDRGSVGVLDSHIDHPQSNRGSESDPGCGLCHYGKERAAMVVMNGCLGRKNETVVKVEIIE